MLRKLKKGLILLLVLSFVFGSTSFASAGTVGETDKTETETTDLEEEPKISEETVSENSVSSPKVEESKEVKEEPKKEEKIEPLTDIYYEWQTESEILALAEQGLDLQEFFQYSIWTFVTEDHLKELVEAGHTLDDVYAVIEKLQNGEIVDFSTVPLDVYAVLEAYASSPALMALGDTRTAGFSGSVSSALGNIPALGSGSHGPMLKIHLSGETAFCAQFGAACRTGMVYTSVPLADIGIDSSEEGIIKGLLAQYKEAQATYTGPVNYIMTQAGVWLVQNGAWTGDANAMAASVAPLFTKTPDCPSVEFAASYFRAIVEWLSLPEKQSLIDAINLEAWANGPNQYLITATGSGISDPVGFAHIEIMKVDSVTGNPIAYDGVFTLYEWNGSSYVKSESRIYREGNKYVSDDLICSLRNEGKFYVEETKAPANGSVNGYYGDFNGSSKNRYEIVVTEDMQGQVFTIANAGSVFENERVTGSIEVLKEDIEASAYLTGYETHGMAMLDGAIYDLFAKEDVTHPDGVTGVLYQKDELVASGTIVEGSCKFTDLYLGKYYIKERQKGETLADGKKLSYATGYLLDETIYNVELPYEGEGKANIHRRVKSNKEQVIKAKAVFEKVESATGQGNINYLEGAGFTIYQIDRLSRADEFVKNADGTYDEQSILEAYETYFYNEGVPKYDFSEEEDAIAILYLKRTTAREDTAFYWEESLKDYEAGRLNALGDALFQVAELFSDENGRVETPYLPYGQYLVVETTVPKDHFQAPPFVLTFNEGKTTKVLTTGVTEYTMRGENILKSSGDEKGPYEAVYFSKVIDNEAVEQLLRICKMDTDTGEIVLLANTKFKIAKLDETTGEKTYLTQTQYYPGTVNADTFATNEKGYLQLPELLPVGLYQIEEVDGPNGFYNDVPEGYVQFRVTTDRRYEALFKFAPDGTMIEGDLGKRDVLLIIEKYFNRETRGELTIRKQGEVLTGFKEATLKEKVKGFFGLDSKKVFTYEERPLSGAEYTIRAAEDIETQDRQTDKAGNRTLWFEKGEVIAVITTGEDGQVDETKVSTATYPNGHPIVTILHEGSLGSVKVYLPLGSYTVEETKAPYGFTKSEEVHTVTFTWEHQFEEYVFNSKPLETNEEWGYNESNGSIIVTNKRVKAVPEKEVTTPGVGMFKSDKESDLPLSGVTFGIYTKDAIYTREGELLAEAGELLSTCTTKADGKAVFDIDLPIRDERYGEKEKQNSGMYEIRELETPSGILLDDTPIPVLFTYVDENTEFVIINRTQQNASSKVYISKQDIGNGEELKGAKLSVLEEFSGKTALSWTSTGEQKEIRGLAVNETVDDNTYTYILREETAPKGYLVAEEIRFKLVKETVAEGAIKNSVYVFDKDSKEWVAANEATVVMKDKPREEPKKPETPSDDTSKPKQVETPETGDTLPVEWMLVAMVIALTGLGVVAWYCWKKIRR